MPKIRIMKFYTLIHYPDNIARTKKPELKNSYLKASIGDIIKRIDDATAALNGSKGALYSQFIFVNGKKGEKIHDYHGLAYKFRIDALDRSFTFCTDYFYDFRSNLYEICKAIETYSYAMGQVRQRKVSQLINRKDHSITNFAIAE